MSEFGETLVEPRRNGSTSPSVTTYSYDGNHRAVIDEDTSGGILYYGPFRIDKATGALVDVALPGGPLCLICQNIDILERDHRRIGDIRSFFAVKDDAFFQGDIMNHCKKAVRGNTNSGIPAGDPGDMDV